MKLSPDQEKATEVFTDFLMHPTQKEMVISGSPGRGKTFLTKHLLSVAYQIGETCKMLNIHNDDTLIIPTATTGKAASVLGKALNMETNTIHSALGIRPKWDWQTKTQKLVKTQNYQVKHNALVLIDEVSGVDPTLQSMVRSSLNQCKTLKIGDKRQLPAVGQTTCCEFDNPEVYVELTTPQRFSASSHIQVLGAQMEHTIDTGLFQPLHADGKDVEYIDGEKFEKLVALHFNKHLRNSGKSKILCWSNRMVNGYNAHIRESYTSATHYEVGEALISNSVVTTGGYKPTCLLRNEEEFIVVKVESGQFHYTPSISGSASDTVVIDGYWYTNHAGTKVFQSDDLDELNRIVRYFQSRKWYFDAHQIKELIADLRPIYASTVHKAQGSTYETVFINLNDIGSCHCWSTVARMLNVAITRASQKVYLYGDLPEKYKDKQHELPTS